tara:strand:- start:89 stop:445 length:357 start_codon:yes stop_codon:yes gene_type:complete
MTVAQVPTKPKAFEVGQICYCNGGCTMQLPTFYKVVRLSKSSVWLQEIHNQLVEHDRYGQRGRKLPVDQPKGEVFRKVIKNWKDSKSHKGDDQQYAYEKYWGIIEPWDGLAKTYDSMD